ncbi:MAG: transcription-repair coupling factor [Anaerolineales bacterium]|nr:transcription-repair coupling factor [Anaerolineales bacterium]
MDLSALLDHLRALPEVPSLLEVVAAGTAPMSALRVPRSARPALVAAIAHNLAQPIVYLVSRTDRELVVQEELAAWTRTVPVLPFPEPNPLFYDCSPWGPRTIRQRASVLAHLTQGLQPGGLQRPPPPPAIILATARALMTRTLPPRVFIANSRWLHVGSSQRLDRLLRLLLETGYQRETLVTEPGGFSHRGGLIDFWPPQESHPIRLEFDGNSLDSLRTFDPATQRSREQVSWVRLTPAREGLPKFYLPEWDHLLPAGLDGDALEQRAARLEYFLPWMHDAAAGLMDYVPEAALVMVDDRAAFEDMITEMEEQAMLLRREQEAAGQLPPDAPIPYLGLAEIADSLPEGRLLDLGYVQTGAAHESALGDRFTAPPRFGGQVREILEFVASRQDASERVVLVSRQAPRMAELWSERGTPAASLAALEPDLAPGAVRFVNGALSDGWSLFPADATPLHLLTDAELFGWGRPRPRPRLREAAAAPEALFADLQTQDLVVHVDFGIGQFAGLVERTVDDIRREFLQIEYADGAQLFVPIHQSDRITRYVGSGEASDAPGLSRLGTQEWEGAKQRARAAVELVARDLLDLYARRLTVTGYAFSPDTTWQHELEASFPYIETDDQLRALEAVKRDMESSRPMDRLICGDVGYGKTEVALRAAFKAVLDGKQVALLVPTTILAQQHLNTFQQRLAAFPVSLEMLSRFRTRQEATEIVERLAKGEIDVIIGTHRLLQKDVRLRDLGLLIIDEEQRFGVTHKEFLKKLRTEIDVLTLTATPIPRTLYMALTGARDISTINTPPDDRLPVVTHVGAYDPRLVRQAILREVDRGGQVFYVHNRVQTIEIARRRLQQLLPEASVEIAHGQMQERQLAQVMERFAQGEVDVLLSTSIIESGLDFPNANTLIVERADTFGLAQLYQLRGRVGRGAVRAFAYFLRDGQHRSTEEALQRLETLAEHSHLGAGYSLAMRDMEMRGAGDILGMRQHGHISAIGFHLYTRLLASAIERLRAGFPALPSISDRLPLPGMPLDVTVELPLSMRLPEEYIPDRDLRLRLYRRIATLRTLEDIEALQHEMRDRFGEPPEEVRNLLYQIRLKNLAERAGVTSVTLEHGQVLIRLREAPHEALPASLQAPDLRRSKRGLWLAAAGEAVWQRLEQVLYLLGQPDPAAVPAG